MKSNQYKFEELISNALLKLKSNLSVLQYSKLEDRLQTIPKIKQFNVEPYLFIFQTLISKKQMMEYALACFQIMVEENYITSNHYDKLSYHLTPLLFDYSHLIIQIINKIKEPNLSIIQLFFQIHSTIALPQDHLKRFRTVAYKWLIRIFSFSQKLLPPLINNIYEKIKPEEMPHIISFQEQNEQVKLYVSKIIDQLIYQIQEKLQGTKIQKGKYNVCFVCKKPANFYCKDTKISVCGVGCKKDHLEILNTVSILNYQFSDEFKNKIEQILLNNLILKKSPTLSIDFLSSIYLYSSYIPAYPLPHLKILQLPVIFQRIWLLYLCYYEKKNQVCQHIFASGLTVSNQFIRQMSSEYFIQICGQERLFQLYFLYDLQGSKRLFTSLLVNFEDQKKMELIQIVVDNIFNHYVRSNNSLQDNHSSLIRSLNHEKQLPFQIFRSLYGENYEQKMIQFILKNQNQINREKLAKIITKNDSFLKLFLKKLIDPIKQAPIDQILRQIFYFISIKASDIIYHLLELLCEVYQPLFPFNELNFFQYAYFIIMIVTELQNPGIIEKPTLASLLPRIEKFHPVLVNSYSHLIRQMFQRIKVSTFSQSSRGILNYYPSVKRRPIKNYLPEIIIVENWQLIYETLIANKANVKIIYRICFFLLNNPGICQAFLQLKIDRLADFKNRDQSLIPAIRHIIQEQPNSVGYLWKSVFQEIKQHKQQSRKIRNSTKTDSSSSIEQKDNCFNLNSLIHSTQLLTNDNFFNFCKQFCLNFSMTSEIDSYIQLIVLNKQRIHIINGILTSNFEKVTNNYIKIRFIRLLGPLLTQCQVKDCAYLFIQMLKTIPVDLVTESLILQCLIKLDIDAMINPIEIWNIIIHLCLQFQDEKKISIIEKMMKNSKFCEGYESYLIQKTLNCKNQQLISEQILGNLQKLEPYIDQINPELLKLFVLPSNIFIIIKHFKKFYKLQDAYQLILTEIRLEDCRLGEETLSKFIQQIKNILVSQQVNINQEELLSITSFPLLILALFQRSTYREQILLILDKYFSFLDYQPLEINQKVLFLKIVHWRLFTQQIAELTFLLVNLKQVCENDKLAMQNLSNILKKLNQIQTKYQKDIKKRSQMEIWLKNYKQLKKMPAVIDSLHISCKTIFLVQNKLKESPYSSFLLHQLKSLLSQLKQIKQRNQLNKLAKPSYLQKLSAYQVSLLTDKYVQILIQDLNKNPQMINSFQTLERQSIKNILIQKFLVGKYNMDTNNFESLGFQSFSDKLASILSIL